MRTQIQIVGTAKTISQHLAALQRQGLVPSGPEIRWDSRDDRHEDFLATSEQHARNVLNGDV